MEEETTVGAPAAAPRRGGMKKLVIMVLPILLLVGGGAWWFLGGSGAKVEAEEETNIEERGVVALETFLVNLTDPGGNRFLKVTLQLVFESDATAKHVQENAALIGHARSAILELLSEQNAQALVTAEGKAKLKEGVKASVGNVLKKFKVIDVLFSEFVVQF